jgi:O-antigen/teichoic acid export membrane protein
VTIRRNTLITLAGQVAAVAISLTTVPLFLRFIGDAKYGVLLLVWLLLGYFSLFDLGLSQATAQRMATLRDATPEERSGLLWTALGMNAFMGAVAAIVLFVAGHLILGRFVSMDPVLRQESLSALPWIAGALPISMAASTLNGALLGREAFTATTVIGTLGQALTQGLPLLVAWRWSRSLAWLIPAALAARLVSGVFTYAACTRLVPLRGRPTYQAALGRALLRYGGWVTVSSVVGPLMSSLDRLLIGGISGSQAVTYYGVPHGLAARLLMLPSSLSGALFPRFASSGAERRAELAEASVRVLACAMTPAVLVGLLLVEPFLTVWISPDFAARAAAAARIILLGVWANGLALVAFSNLQAMGRPDLVAKVHLVELPLYMGLLASCLHLWGVVGAAVAWTVRVGMDAILLYGLSGYLRSLGPRLAFPIALLAATQATLSSTEPHAPGRWLVGGALLLVSVGWALARFPWHLLPARATARA